MRRYERFLKFVKDSEGNNRYESIRYPSFPVRETDQYIVTKELDRLDILSYEFYNDTTLWWIIARANNLPPGTFRIPAGSRLRIPFPISDSPLYQLTINSQF